WIFFFQAEDGIRDWSVTGVQTCALPISNAERIAFLVISLKRTRRKRPFVSLVSSSLRCQQIASPSRSGSAARKIVSASLAAFFRSEERRVGKECRVRGWPDLYKSKERTA